MTESENFPENQTSPKFVEEAEPGNDVIADPRKKLSRSQKLSNSSIKRKTKMFSVRRFSSKYRSDSAAEEEVLSCPASFDYNAGDSFSFDSEKSPLSSSLPTRTSWGSRGSRHNRRSRFANAVLQVGSQRNALARFTSMEKLFQTCGHVTLSYKVNEAALIQLQALGRGWLARKRYKKLVRDLEQRQKLVKELLATEQSYGVQIRILAEKYMRPLREANPPILKPKVVDAIFCNLKELIDINGTLLMAFHERSATYGQHSRLADIFWNILLPNIDAYTNYCLSYGKAMFVLTEQMEKYPSFTKFIQTQHTSHLNECTLHIPALLIVPIQRLLRYKLLLSELIKHTPTGHLDLKFLNAVFKSVGRLADSANEIMAKRDNLETCTHIQKSITGCPMDIVTPDRFFKRKGVLTKQCRKNWQRRMFFLFSDILLYTSESNANQYKFHRHFPLVGMKVVDMPDKLPISNQFRIVTSSKSFVVYASSSQEKVSWIESINGLLRQVKQKAREEGTPELVTETAPVWIQDSQFKTCRLCNAPFTVIRRRHHCRKCGSLVCGACSSRTFRLANIGKKCRVCDPCFEELSGVNVRKKKNVNTGKILPKDLLWLVFLKLDIRTLGNVLSVCRYWNEIGRENLLWKRIYQRDWKKSEERMLLLSHKSWLEAYSTKLRNESNWRSGAYTSRDILGHQKDITGLYLATKKRLLSSSLDGVVKLWDVNSGCCLESFEHSQQAGVTSLHCEASRAVSGGEDGVVRVWDMNTGNKLLQLRSEEQAKGVVVAITSLFLDEKLLYCGASDGTISGWDLYSGSCVFRKAGHSSRVSCLQSRSRSLLTAGHDSKIRLWDLKSNRCLYYLTTSAAVNSIQWNGEEEVYAGNEDGVVEGWSLSFASPHHIFWSSHPGQAVTHLVGDETKLVSCGDDGGIKVWGRTEGEDFRQCCNTFEFDPLSPPASSPLPCYAVFDDSSLCVSFGSRIKYHVLA